MNDSDLYDSSLRIFPGLASSYSRNITEAPVPGGRLAVSRVRIPHQATDIGATSIVTPPPDVLRWANNYRNNTLGGGQGLVEAMETPYVLHAANGTALPVDYVGTGGYGGGLMIMDAAVNNSTVKVILHGGAVAGYRSVLLRVPDVGLVIVLQATSTALNTSFQLAARIAVLTGPDVFGSGGEGDTPEPLAAEATPEASVEPVATPSPAKPASV